MNDNYGLPFSPFSHNWRRSTMSTKKTEEAAGAMERRSFLQYAGGAALAGAAALRSTDLFAAGAARSKYSGGPAAASAVNKYDKMYVATVTPYKPGTEDIDYNAYRSFVRYFAQPKFINANGGILVTPEAGEVFYLTTQE